MTVHVKMWRAAGVCVNMTCSRQLPGTCSPSVNGVVVTKVLAVASSAACLSSAGSTPLPSLSSPSSPSPSSPHDLHTFSVALIRTTVNHDGHGGTAPDALVWIILKNGTLCSGVFYDFASHPKLRIFWVNMGFLFQNLPICLRSGRASAT